MRLLNPLRFSSSFSSVRSLSLQIFVAVMMLGLAIPTQAAGEAGQDEQRTGRLTEVMTVTLNEAKRLYDLGAVFIDVRGEAEWKLGRIRNARHVNFRRNFARLKTLEGITTETPLVFYCSMPECKVGPYASAVSIEWGFENVFYFPRGYFAWMLQDYPIEMEPTPSQSASSLSAQVSEVTAIDLPVAVPR